MYYEINVAKRYPLSIPFAGNTHGYKHYFATSERSFIHPEVADEAFKHFCELFPWPEYNITMSRKVHSGQEIRNNMPKEVQDARR